MNRQMELITQRILPYPFPLSEGLMILSCEISGLSPEWFDSSPGKKVKKRKGKKTAGYNVSRTNG